MEDFGFKPFVMKLLSHPEEAVGKAALECMQKLLIKNWEFLGMCASPPCVVGFLGTTITLPTTYLLFRSVFETCVREWAWCACRLCTPSKHSLDPEQCLSVALLQLASEDLEENAQHACRGQPLSLSPHQ